MQPVALLEAGLCAEIQRARGRAEIIPLRDRQERDRPARFDALVLRRANRHLNDVEHRKMRAARDIAAQNHLKPLVEHGTDRRDAACDVRVRVRAVHDGHAVRADRFALARVAVDAVRHQRVGFEQPVFVVGLPVLRAVRMQRTHQLDLACVLGKMRLHRQIALVRKPAEPCHQLVRTRRRKARRQHRTDAGKPVAGVEPAQCFALALLRRFAVVIGAAAVHIDLADIARNASALEFLHKNQRRVRVQRREHAHARRAVADEPFRKAAVVHARIVGIGKAGFGAERVGVEPV